MSAYEPSIGGSDEWYTPPAVFEALGVRFDMDVAHPGAALAPWVPADRYLTRDGLTTPWRGFVWMNPPFGKRMGIQPWLAKFFAHGDGIALTPDRTSAPWWIDAAAKADAVLFVGKPNPQRGDPNKIQFIPGPGVRATSNGTGTTLFAVGRRGVEALRRARDAGFGLVLTTHPTPKGGDDA